ncbi:serine/threonine-protein kinase [Sulfuricaulis limicola]|uniref:serine/threonine-protein kinase n=1 Tax=Sulfuricaulis limicola TaxID=1620215 RepID=UPI000BBAB2E0|nr:serine/threonine-protein kinase [Sulfuricaulis limicola]
MQSSDIKTQILSHSPAVTPGAAQNIAETLAARYEVMEALGDGGMGMVYRVRDRETNEILALKLLRPEIARDPAMMERFKNEIRLAHRITHKNVCRIYDFNRVDDLAYFTMEHVDGESLRAWLKRAGKLTPERTIDLARQITAGLGEAHARGVVHRDLKPENVMLGRDGLVKLLDFGIARALDSDTATARTIMGTPEYMAPEQSQGKAVDQRVDLYALGLILYECLTGRRAFSGATPVEIALKQLKEKPQPPRKFLPTTPPHLEAVVLRCLEKDPARRFASAAELQRALVQPGAPPRQGPRLRKTAVFATIGLLAVLAAYKLVNRQDTSSASVQARDATTSLPDQQQVPEELVKLFEAAKQGDAVAQERVGRLYLDGPARARDERKAFFWTRQAALSGDGNAQFTLAQMYESGRGAPHNLVGAFVWYNVALSSGNESARVPFERLKEKISSDELAEAEQQLHRLRRGR